MTIPPVRRPEPVSVVRNVRPWGGAPCDIAISGDRIVDIRPHAPGTAQTPAAGAPPAGAQGALSRHSGPGDPGSAVAEAVVDGHGLLALPGIVNAHAHVDKSWWGLPWQSYAGEPTTEGRIAHERALRDDLGIPGAEQTARVLEQMVSMGTTAIRTHVDVDTGLGLRGIEVVRAAAAAYEGALDVQIVAFPQDGILRRPGVAQLLRTAAEQGAECIGGLDPAGIDRDPVGQLDLLTALAADTGTGIDIHLHDPGELGAFQIELLCDLTEQRGLRGRVNLAHAFALAQVDSARRSALLERMGGLGMTVTTVAPLRLPQLPHRELAEHGVRLGLGTDGIRDLWSPYGTGDTLGIAWQFARASALNEDGALLEAVRLATTDGAWAVGRGPGAHDLVVGARADIVLVDAVNPMDALVRTPDRAAVIAGGRRLR
ncbi:amidohydrolase family protein [Brevibacterium sp. 5221]|uniref:Amidohydrolase family protein n=1 Tax=Brevibacterium rongguiense TaxID=2695267 RepID=A0A6N9H3D8_9MICO|nr:amidohydrolase family protein [Brevibacterium rongguiense]MYM18550.1 amidohydrolase family protein [Brevibacterium rongguiense]